MKLTFTQKRSMNLPNSCTCTRWKLKITQVFFNRWWILQTVGHGHPRIPSSNKRNAWYMQRLRWVHRELHRVTQLTPKAYVLYDCILTRFYSGVLSRLVGRGTEAVGWVGCGCGCKEQHAGSCGEGNAPPWLGQSSWVWRGPAAPPR